MRHVSWVPWSRPDLPKSKPQVQLLVSDDRRGLITGILWRLLALPNHGREAIQPDGLGLPHDQLNSARRALDEEDVWSHWTWDEENPAPDPTKEELWILTADFPSRAILIPGPELRALLEEAIATRPADPP